MACRNGDLRYHERLSVLGLETLEQRRLENDARFVWKILHNKVEVDDDLLTATPHDRLYQPLARTKAYRESFGVRAVRIYNQLPQETMESRTMKQFDRNLKNFNFRDKIIS
ncbi:unnamed protein product [Sphagnum balticum]